MRMMQDLAKDLIEKAPPRVVAAPSVPMPCIWAFPRFDRIEKCAIEKDQCGRGAVEALPIPRQAGTRAPGERPFLCPDHEQVKVSIAIGARPRINFGRFCAMKFPVRLMRFRFHFLRVIQPASDLGGPPARARHKSSWRQSRIHRRPDRSGDMSSHRPCNRRGGAER